MRTLTPNVTIHPQIDEYLDLLNLAVQLGDEKWQREIIRKLSYMHHDAQQD
ncbi:hypothetical protein J2Z69_002591 [Paenibacillus shirakamiensis]|uniref:IDEAL domain-containing protein n=1 Tax=Paenibacillus shirakamiensis TaxID=1265935 RepID=A0ABS4JIK6_9BACL|nr:hypothetical protein [Paenibacillus shirakamiensis]MBP2001546.1 hypothetical protein [Paenibacillus shirakamiensis]